MRRDDEGVSTVIGALLVLTSIVLFMAVYNLTWQPVLQENREAAKALELRESMTDWGDTAESFVTRGLANRSFTRTLTIGALGSGLSGKGGYSGSIALETTPTLVVSRGGTTLASLTGALQAESKFQRIPTQDVRYVFGALEVVQGSDAWADLRGLLSASRASGGTLGLTIQAVGISGAAQSQGGSPQVDAVGTVESAATSSQSSGTIRIHATGVQGGAWRAAATRTLSSVNLAGETAASCVGSTQDWCLDSTTNSATVFDLYLLNVGSNWSLTQGVVRVDLRA